MAAIPTHQPSPGSSAILQSGNCSAFGKKIQRQKCESENIRILSKEQVFGGSARVVAVEGPVKDHFAFSLEALESGKHVHVEKPPADTTDGMRRLVDVARKKNLLLQSGYMWRYHPGFDKVIEASRNGWLGDIDMARGQINTLIEASRRPEWGMFKGGQMFELGAHLIDALVRLMGAPAKITPFLRKQGGYNENLLDNTVVVFEYAHALAVIQSATLQPGAGAPSVVRGAGNQRNGRDTSARSARANGRPG